MNLKLKKKLNKLVQQNTSIIFFAVAKNQTNKQYF